MKRAFCWWVLGIVLPVAAVAQTNAPRTLLEALESHTNTVIVRGLVEVGVVDGTHGGVSVVARESTDKNTRQKALGVAVTVRGRNAQDVSLIDHEELESLVRGLDQLTSPQWSDTSMPQMEMVYTTRDGLRFTSFSNRHGTGAEATVQSTHFPVQAAAVLNSAQLTTLRNFLDQARGKLDAIGRVR